MSIPFQYCYIDSKFIGQILNNIQRQDSSVLLGARYSGCHDVIHEIAVRLQGVGHQPLVLNFSSRYPVRNLQQFSEKLFAVINASYPEHSLIDAITIDDDLLHPISKLAKLQEQPIILLAESLDSMAHHLARPFLQSVRALVTARKLIVVLSGESDLQSLVYGPNSEFNCANQYVVQGYSKECFISFTERANKLTGVQWKNSDGIIQRMYETTGGNSHLYSMLIRRVISRSENCHEPVSVSGFPDRLEDFDFQIEHGADVFRRASSIINQSLESWNDLRRLMVYGGSAVPAMMGTAPTLLELSGIAHREKNRLVFSSPLMAEYILNYYDARRFGDLYAMRGHWEEAFRQFERIEPEERIRPLDIDDKIHVQQVIDSFGISLNSVAAEGLPKVRELFERGCNYVLGFPTVAFCIKDDDWCLDPKFVAHHIDLELLNTILGSFPSELTLRHTNNLNAKWHQYAMVILLPSLRAEHESELVIVGDLDRRTTISQERREMVAKLGQHLQEAYALAVDVQRSTLRSHRRERYSEIISQIFDALGKKALDVESVLRLAGRGLRTMGYKRALFCLVDPERIRIQGHLDDADPPVTDSKTMLEGWLLSEPTADLQPYVVYTRLPKIVVDATKEPLADQSVVEKAGIKGVAIVPMLNRGNDAVGTIHLERQDGFAPSKEAVEDLLNFAHELAIAIEQSLRINALQSTLDAIPEPVAITDVKQRLVYANQPAAELMKFSSGWGEKVNVYLEKNEQLDHVVSQLRRTVQDKRRILNPVEQIANNSEWRGYVLTDVIRDWRGVVTGSLLHIQNLDYIYRTFEALQMVASADSVSGAQKAMLRATAHLGHSWQRLYLIDRDNSQKMHSVMGAGFMKLSFARRFMNGEIVLPSPHVDKADSWLCIQRKKMVVCHYGPEVPFEHPMSTDYGLDVINVVSPSQDNEIAKQPGDFWIDIPLFIDEKPWGKLSLQCDKLLKPEECAFLSVLAEAFSELLEAFQRNDENAEKRERWIHEAAETAMSLTAHSVATRLAGLPALLSRYQLQAEKYPEIQDLNDEFFEIWQDTAITIKRTKERLTTLTLKPHELELIRCLEMGLRSSPLDNDQWSIECARDSIMMHSDGHLLRNALSELVQNSIDAILDTKSLRIRLRIRLMANRKIIIDYRDNGPGIPKCNKKLIFDDFFTHRPDRKLGIGLGLAYVRRVVNAHSGSIDEVGRQGFGARFVIILPLGITQTNLGV